MARLYPRIAKVGLVSGGLHVFGRNDQVFKASGERMSLLEVEAALLASGAREALAWKETDENSNDRVVAVIAGNPRTKGSSSRATRETAAQRLAATNVSLR